MCLLNILIIYTKLQIRIPIVKQFFIRYVAFLFLIYSIIFIGMLYSNHRNQFVLFIDYFQSMNKENLINDFRGMFGFFYE